MKIKIENVGRIKHFEAEITDLMVFIGPDGTLNGEICDTIRSHINRESKRYVFSTIVHKYPETGLFPIAQNDLVAHYANLLNSGPSNRLLMTTHSPYILTALNNYIYAYQVGQKCPDEVSALIPKHLWIDPKRVSAYFVENGTARSIMDEELQHICAEEIDQASTLTNELYDKLLEIKIDADIDEEAQRIKRIQAEEIDVASDLTNSLHCRLLEIELNDEPDNDEE